MQRGRDSDGWQRAGEHVAIAFLAQQTALQDALCQLLDEQRYAVGAIDDLGDDIVGQCLATGDLLDQYGAVAPVQSTESQHADLRLADPGRLELRAERHNQ